MNVLNNKIPAVLQLVCEQVVKDFWSGNKRPDGVNGVFKWLESEYWLIDGDFVGESATDLCGLSNALKEDAGEDRFNIQHAKRVSEEYFSGFFFYKFDANNGQSVVFVILGEFWGQGGWTGKHYDIYDSKESFIQETIQKGDFWLEDIMGEIPDEKLLSLWE